MVYQSLNHCGIDSTDWSKAEGLIVRVKTPGVNYKSADPSIKYEYQVDNTLYSSKRVVCGNLGTGMGHASKYAIGKKVTVYYNPSHPHIAVLEPGIPKDDLIEGVICVLFGLLFALFAIYYAHQHQERIFAPY